MASITTRKNKKGLSYLVRIRRKDSPPLTATFPSKTKAVVWARNEESKIDKGDTSTEMDINKRTIRIPVERSKNGRAFTLGITDELYPYAKFLVENGHPESGLLFPHPSNPFKRLCYRADWDVALKLAGIINFRFHDCRHTTGSYMAMSGCSLTEIAEQLNHKTLEMAKRYSHLADEYRAKIPVKMNATFLSETSAAVAHVIYTTAAAPLERTKAPEKGIIPSKTHLRLL